MSKNWEKTKAYIDERMDEVYKKAYNAGFNDGTKHQRELMMRFLVDTESRVAYEIMKQNQEKSRSLFEGYYPEVKD